MRSSISSRITTITSRRRTSRAPIPISRRIRHQRADRPHAPLATRALLERDDVIIVASVSCIYGIGSVETYTAMTFSLKLGDKVDQRQLVKDLVALQYKRVQAGDFSRGLFRVRGDTIEVFPAHYEDRAWRIGLFGDEIEFDRPVRSAYGCEDARPRIRQDLRQFALCDAAPDALAIDRGDEARAQGAPGPAPPPRTSAGGPTA